MNNIEYQIKKFLSIKCKLPNNGLTFSEADVKKTTSDTIFAYLYKKHQNFTKKNIPLSKSPLNQNLTEKTKEAKSREPQKFVAKKFEITPKNKSEENDDESMGLNLLMIANGEMNEEKNKKKHGKEKEESNNKKKEVQKTKIEEAGNKDININNEEKKENKKNKEDIEIKDKENKEDISMNEEEKEKLNILDEIDFSNIKNELSITKRTESGLNIPKNFNIFAKLENKLKNDRNDSYNYNDSDNESIEDKNEEAGNKEEEKKEQEKINNDNNNNNENKVKEQKENEIKESNNLKICIPLEEDDKEKNDNNVTKNSPQIKKEKPKEKKIISNNINSNKILQNKVKRTSISEVRKSSIAGKTEKSIINEKKIISSKIKKKIISDEEDEDGYDEDYVPAKEIKKTKNEDNLKQNNENNAVTTNDGHIIKLFFNDNKNFNDINEETNKKNEKNDNNIINKKSENKKDTNINIENTSDNKNKINKNIINKNKNGSQNISAKKNNNINNYDLSCINNIHDILISIKDILNSDDKGKSLLNQCFNIIKNIKSKENNIQRKKETYIKVLTILRKLFNYFSENNPKNYINEMIAILTLVNSFYKNVKENDKLINQEEFYYKRKIALKYVFSKFELKNYENNNLKELCKNTNDINNNNKKGIKFIKTFKRYQKTSTIMNKELKNFCEKLEKSAKTQLVNQLINKYEYCPADIQMSPHLMGYKRLFSHFGLIFSFYYDYNNLNNELEEIKKKNTHDDKKKGKSIQVNRNGVDKRDTSVNSVKMKKNYG